MDILEFRGPVDNSNTHIVVYERWGSREGAQAIQELAASDSWVKGGRGRAFQQ